MLEVKLNIFIESNLISQLKQYVCSEYICLLNNQINKITDFEIHYINERKEGQNLRVYKKVESNVIDCLIMEKEREIVRAKLLFE